MAENNRGRNEANPSQGSIHPKKENTGQERTSGGSGSERSPQEGSQWNNYQTREMSPSQGTETDKSRPEK